MTLFRDMVFWFPDFKFVVGHVAKCYTAKGPLVFTVELRVCGKYLLFAVLWWLVCAGFGQKESGIKGSQLSTRFLQRWCFPRINIARIGTQLAFLGFVPLLLAEGSLDVPLPLKPLLGLEVTSKLESPGVEVRGLFISGHSLTDQPMPDLLEAIAKSLNTPLDWNRQYLMGSSIAARSRGAGKSASDWSGYRGGANKTSSGLDVIEELREANTIRAPRYDALLITEEHGLLDSLRLNDTTRHLRHYHDRLVDGNAQAITYFYESWLGLIDKSDPRSWIAYERAASPIWQCIGTRINLSLSLEGRKDRIMPLPAGLALAKLVSQATSESGLPDVTKGSVRETVDGLFRDDVHLTQVGSYYIALTIYAAIYGKSPVGAAFPPEIPAGQAKTLQQFAWEFVAHYRSTNKPLTLTECQTMLKNSFIGHYARYTRDASRTPGESRLLSYTRWISFMAEWQWLIRQQTTKNPFFFDPASDSQFWLPWP